MSYADDDIRQYDAAIRFLKKENNVLDVDDQDNKNKNIKVRNSLVITKSNKINEYKEATKHNDNLRDKVKNFNNRLKMANNILGNELDDKNANKLSMS